MSRLSLTRLGASIISSVRTDAKTTLAVGTCALIGRPNVLGASRWSSRSLSTDNDDKKDELKARNDANTGEAEKPGTSAPNGDAAADTSLPSEPSTEELIAQMKFKEDQAAKLTHQVEGLTDQLRRTLADMENLRARTAREVEGSKKFAIQGFVKALLDVPDNLERAAGVVPPEALKEDGGIPPEKLRSLLSGLLEGVRATENILMKVLKQNGVDRYDPTGQAFDPNLHNALFDVPDPSKDNNTIAIVTKKGYKLNDRVIRPAEVGVVRNVSS